jgi:transducin (beta)-like 1
LWDADTGACLQVLADHQKAVYALAFSPDGRCLATGSGDGYVHIYDVKVGVLLHFFRVPPDLCKQEKEKKWSWFMDTEKCGVFEIDWQQSGKINRIALALESRLVGIVDVSGMCE